MPEEPGIRWKNVSECTDSSFSRAPNDRTMRCAYLQRRAWRSRRFCRRKRGFTCGWVQSPLLLAFHPTSELQREESD